MKYILEYKSFSEENIKNGLKKSIEKGDIKVVTNVDNVIKNMNDISDPFDIYNIIYHQDEIFVSEALPKKLLDFIKSNNINIDYSKLEDSIKKVKELYNTEDDLNEILYNNENNKLVDEYHEKIDKLRPYQDIREDETIRIIKYLRKNTKDPR
jgi:uncharacterized protein YpuA (DUF1002 family)